MENNNIVIYVDSVARNREEMTFSLFGWAIDNVTHELVNISVEDNPSIKNVEIEGILRYDVNPIFMLPQDAECGFYIKVNLKAFDSVINIVFENKGHRDVQSFDMRKKYCHRMEAGNPQRKRYEILQKVQKYTKRSGLKNAIKGIFHRVTNNDSFYQTWIDRNETKSGAEYKAELEKAAIKPLISVVMPTYNVESIYLKKCIQSVIDQYYDNWELCIADDCSTLASVRETLEEFKDRDARIHVTYREKNGHISAATNTAIAMAKGEFVCLLDNDDTLAPNALVEVVLAINENPDVDLIYSDEDNITADDKRKTPYFKSDFAPDSLMCNNYICHISVYRKSILDEVGGFRVGYEGAQDHDLLLRVTEKTDRIVHIPKILYHWRQLKTSTAVNTKSKTYAYDAGIRAVSDAIERRGLKGEVTPGELPGHYKVHYEITEDHLVSIVIPTRDGADILKVCIDSILERTDYPSYEIIIADNGSEKEETLSLFKHYTETYPDKIKVVRIDIPFNFARINNIAVREASKGDMLLFLNNDTEVIRKDWLTQMVALCQLKHIGAVGAKLYYPDDTIQHAGVVVGLGGAAGHIHYNFPKDSKGYFGKLVSTTNYLAVTAACLMVRREVFDEVDGYTESFVIAFNDIDFCLKIYDHGYYNVWTPEAELYHFESKSRGYEDSPEKKKRFIGEINRLKQAWPEYIARDPFYSPNLTLAKNDFSINLE